jgi:hypothetical protein
MPDPSEQQTQKPRRKWLRRSGYSLIAIAVAIGVGVALLPTVATWQVETQLEALGARSVKVEGLSINPATGHISVERFASVGPDGEDIAVGAATLKISLSALARRQITIQKLSVADADIDLRLNKQGQWSVGGFSIAIADDKAQTEPKKSWQLKANNISVDNSRMTLSIGETLQVAMVEALRVDNLSTLRPDAPAVIDLTARAAGGRIKINGNAFPFAEFPNLSASVEFAGIDLKTLKSLIATGRIKDISGIAALKGDLKAGMTKTGGATVRYAGAASLSATRTDTTLFKTQSRALSWTGDASIGFANPSSAVDSPPDIRLNGVASASAFLFENKTTGMALVAETAKFDLSKSGVSLKTPPQKNAATKVTGRLNARLSEARFEQPDSGLRIAPRQLTIDGTVDLTLPPRTAAFSARLSGSLSTKALDGMLTSAGIDKLTATALQLTYDKADVSISAAGGISAKTSASMNISGLNLIAPAFGISAVAQKIGSAGQEIAFERADTGEIDLSLDGPFTAEDVAVDSEDKRWRAAQKKLTWDGKIGLKGAAKGSDTPGRLSLSGDASMAGMTAMLNGNGLQEAYSIKLDNVGIKQFSLEGDNAGLATVSLSGMAASGTSENSPLPQIGLKTLLVSGITSDKSTGVKIKSLRASGLRGRLTKSRDGAIAFPKTDAENPSPTTNQTDKPSSSATPPTLRIDEATLTDGSLEFVDQATDPAFSIATSRLQGSLKNFDTAKPGSNADIRLLVGLGKFGRLETSGTLKPRFDKITADLGVGFKNVELFKFNSYISPAIKHSVRQGRADGNVDLTLRSDVIKASTSIVVSRLKVKPLAAKSNASGKGKAEGSGPPMETAINLLQNDKGVMKLSIPISGSLDDPKFDLSDAIGQAVAGAMQKTILTAVKIAFPLGTVFAIVDAVGNPKIEIKPLAFAPGTSALTPALKSRTAEIAAYLKKKTDDTPSICGPATTADITALKSKNPKADKTSALKTAEARIAGVRDELISAHSIPAKRLFVCAPEFAEAAEQQPFVTVERKN